MTNGVVVHRPTKLKIQVTLKYQFICIYTVPSLYKTHVYNVKFYDKWCSS